MQSVFIAVPYHKVTDPEAEFCRDALRLYCLKNGINIKTPGLPEMNASLSFNRNRLVWLALQSGATHLLFIDDDMVYPDDSLARLLQWDKDIVCAVASQRREGGKMCGKFAQNAKPENGLIEMDYVGGAFILVKTELFKKISSPVYYQNYDPVLNEVTDEDYTFSEIAKSHGYKIWADISLSKQMGHIGKQVFYLNESNFPY